MLNGLSRAVFLVVTGALLLLLFPPTLVGDEVTSLISSTPNPELPPPPLASAQLGSAPTRQAVFQVASKQSEDGRTPKLSGTPYVVSYLFNGLRRLAPLLLIVVAWLDVLTHEPTQNPTVPPGVYELNLARADLNMDPQPELGGSRAMVSPMAANAFIHFASGDPKRNFLAKRAGYCANVNLLDAVPKVDGFFSLTPRENDDLLSLFYTTTNADYPQLEDFLGVSQITASGEMFKWQARTTFLPLVTAGQKPVFLDEAGTLRGLTQPDFDGRKIVFLPPETKQFVTVTNQTAARVLKSKFGIQSADIEVLADAPSLVVVAQTWYHEWRAVVDRQPARLLRANHAFQAVEVPEGRHRVQLLYRDRAFEIGAIISLLALLACLFCVAISSRPTNQ